MSSLTRQKILKEIEYLKDEARSLEINTIYTSIHDINFKYFKKVKSTIISPNVENEEQIIKDNRKLGFIKSICTEGKFEWTAKNYIAKTTKNTFENMYEIIYPKGKENDIHCINIVAYHEYIGWMIFPIRSVFKDKSGKMINAITEFRKFVNKIPQLLNYKDPEEFDSVTWNIASKIFYDETEDETFNRIEAPELINKELEHVWSLDLNSAFGSALIKEVPETESYIEQLYYSRKEKPENKQIISSLVGMLGSPYTAQLKGLELKEHAWSQLRFNILKRISDELELTCCILRANGAKILMKKTDSIKFIYPGHYLPKEIILGPYIGQWKIEFQDCKFRMRGIGAYEIYDPYTEKYEVKLSGKTTLDLLKPRTEWQWGDIYQANDIVSWCLNENTLQIEIIRGTSPYECKTKIKESQSRELSKETTRSLRTKSKKCMKRIQQTKQSKRRSR